MTDETQVAESQEKPIEKMTVKELRELAKDIPEITGASSMKKDELLAKISAAMGDTTPDKPAKKAASSSKKKQPSQKRGPMTKADMKSLIAELHQTKSDAKGSDKKEIETLRRRINRLRKRTRKVARAAA